MSAHTPGPWVYEVENSGANFRLYAGEEDIISGCGCCGSPLMCGPFQANARLIVAAPDLLEALENIERWTRTRGGECTIEVVRDCARRAIARAVQS
jgi:hypothetical protein